MNHVLLASSLLAAPLLATLSTALTAQAPAAASAHQKLDLRVLVTGRDDGDRRTDFATFLREHFTTVGTASYSDFTAADAEGWDVVVLDAEVRPKPGRIGLPKGPKLAEDYARATVLVQGAGAIVADRRNQKIDWL